MDWVSFFLGAGCLLAVLGSVFVALLGVGVARTVRKAGQR